MSCYWYFECLDHDPPLRSADEVTQHTGDEHYRRAIRLAANRPVVYESWDRKWTLERHASDSEQSRTIFERYATKFLAEHPTCRLGLISETGEAVALEEHHRERMTFDLVSAFNLRRSQRWHPGFPEDDDTWSIADWCLAMCGEAGEAANVVKKIRRAQNGLPGKLDPPESELLVMLGEEMADVFLYLDLLAAKTGIDLPAAIVRKFNLVSERQDFPERLPEYGQRDAPEGQQ